MNKNEKKKHRFFLFFNLEKNEKKAKIYTSNWFSRVFPQGYIELLTIYKIKVNNVKVDTVFDIATN